MNTLPSENRLAKACWLLALLAMLALAAYFMYTRYSAIVGGDTFTYVSYARLLARGQGTIEGPVGSLIRANRPDDSSWATPVWNTALLPDGRWVYTVAPGYPLFLAALLRVGGEWSMLHANVILQLAVLALFFGLVSGVLRGSSGATGAALFGMALLLSLNVATQHQFIHLWREPWLFFLLLLAASAFVSLDRHPRLYWGIPLLLGLACATKESSILYAGWMGVALLLHPGFRKRPDLRRAIGLGMVVFLLGCGPLLFQNWSFTGRPWTSIYVLRETSQFSATQVGAGLSAGNFMMILGRYAYMYLPFAAGLIPLVLLALWGVWRHRKAPATILFAGWLALHVGLYLQWGNADFRHMYFANYPLVFFAALGLHDGVVRLRRPWLRRAAYALAIVPLLAATIQRQPPRPTYRAREWRTLANQIAAKVDPSGVLLVNRPLRDILGGYADRGIIRFHELMNATGRNPVDLAREIAQGDVPVYFIDAPDRDPASIRLRRNLTALDWKYLLQGCDPVEIDRFEIDRRCIAGFLGRTSFKLYRLEPWSRREHRPSFEIPAGGAAFLSLNPKGLEDDLQIELDGEPMRHDLRRGYFIPLSSANPALQAVARRTSGGNLPLDLDWALIDWETKMVVPVGEDVQPDDHAFFEEIQTSQPIQSRRRFDEAMRMRIPVREGTDLFSVVQVGLPYTAMEGRSLDVDVAGVPGFAAPVSHRSLWISVPPPADVARRAGYRNIRVEIPPGEYVSVDQLVSRAAWRKWGVPKDAGGECGMIVAGFLVPLAGSTSWRYFEEDREVMSGDGVKAYPADNPFASFLPASRVAGIPWLRWEGAGLMDATAYPVGRRFRLEPAATLAMALARPFHAAEKDDTGAFRWTAPNGRIRLPAAPGGTYRLRLDLAYRGMGPASNRVEIVVGDRRESFWVDNETRTYEMTIAEPSLSNGWVDASIEATPWTPTDFGSRDSRTLGVRWYGVEWESLDGGGTP